jgi:hypothetical protein
MASKRDTDLFQALRAAGLRKKVAHAVTDATRKTRPGKQSKLLVRTIENLHTAAAEIERRADGNKRTEAAKKAAQTRKRKATARSTASDKAAQTRTDTEA